jgi:hypothetical protein
MPQTGLIHRHWRLILPGIIAILFLSVVGLLTFRKQTVGERIRQSVVRALAKRFRSEVELNAIHIRVSPGIEVTGEGLTLRHHGRRDVPPLIQLKKFSFTASILGLLRPVKHIPVVRIEDLVINIAPRQQTKDTLTPESSRVNESTPAFIIDKLICENADIAILPKSAGKLPLDWKIHNLVLYSLSQNQSASFTGRLTNGKPVGEIATHGQFGPWDAEVPGNTPVAGEYRFSDADLGPFPGIAGMLSSTGNYTGVLSELHVNGQTDAPDFSLDKVGKPVPLHTEFSATVDGTSGDTLLHSVKATLLRSLIIANGSIVRVPERNGHMISIEASVPNGRIQDFLSLAMNSSQPMMTGSVKIKTKVLLPPGNEKALDKMIMDAQFGVDDAKWNNAAIREKLESLSRHGKGNPKDDDAGSSVSDLTGSFHLQNGVIHFLRLRFSVEGAAIDLAGTYALRGGELDLTGHLRLQAKLSQLVTGEKSLLLKPVDPFFQKGNAGTVLPLRITGTRDNPTFSVSVFHKTFDKQLTGAKPGREGKAFPE